MGERTVADNRAEQTALYGAPLAEVVGRVTARLAISQARTAQVLGLSPSMLSQLVSGHRVKIGNPLVGQRLTALVALCDEVDGGLGHDRMTATLEDIAAAPDTATLSRMRAPSADPADVVRRVLTAMAGGRELRSAADALEPSHPGVAEFLRVYGLGTPEQARAHLAQLGDLLG